MKKLIPMLLAGAFTLTSITNVFASPIIEPIINNPLNLFENLTSLPMGNIENIYSFDSVEDLSEFLFQTLQILQTSEYWNPEATIPVNILNLLTGANTNNIVADSKIIENAEFFDAQIIFNRHNREFTNQPLSIQVQGSEYTRTFIALEDLLEFFWVGIRIDNDTNTINITQGRLNDFEIDRALNPILEPIDMGNINPDEWVSASVIMSILHAGMTHGPSTVSVHGNSERFPDNYNTAFTSIIGCNQQKIRAILEPDIDRFGIKFNLQDIIDSGLFLQEELDEIPEAIKREARMLSDEGPSVEDIARMNVESLIWGIEAGLFSDERLEELLTLIKPHIEN